MIDAKRVCLIIPCYNEAKRLNSLAFREYLGSETDKRFIFVDDGSRDHTLQVLEQLAVRLEDSTVILRGGRNRGKAEAVRLGILYALDHFHPQYIGFWDADLATPLDTINRLVHTLDLRPEVEMIFGARIQLLGHRVHRRAVRHYLGRTFATVVSTILRLAIYDTQCGAKIFRVTPGMHALFAEPFLSKWVFDVEILARYQRLFRSEQRVLPDAIYEYPLEAWTDVAGSKVHAGDFFKAFWDVFRIWRKYL